MVFHIINNLSIPNGWYEDAKYADNLLTTSGTVLGNTFSGSGLSSQISCGVGTTIFN